MKKHASVYVIDLGEGAVKIGHSIHPQQRRKALKLDHCEFGYISKVYEQAELVERAAHKILQGEKIYGETFRVSVERACEAIAAAEQLIYGGLQPDDYSPPEGREHEYPRQQINIIVTEEELKMVDALRRSWPHGIPTVSDVWRQALRELYEQRLKKASRTGKAS